MISKSKLTVILGVFVNSNHYASTAKVTSMTFKVEMKV